MMRRATRSSLVLAMLLTCWGCQSSGKARSDGGGASVTHVVLCWLKTPGDEAARERLIEASKSFESIPGVVKVTAGRAIPSTRPVVDSSYDVAFVMTFTDKAALDAYEVHPTHVKAVQEVMRPVVGKVVVYDVAHADAGKAPAR